MQVRAVSLVPSEVGAQASDRLLPSRASGLQGKFPNCRRGAPGSARVPDPEELGRGGDLPAGDLGLTQLRSVCFSEQKEEITGRGKCASSSCCETGLASTVVVF